MASHSAATEQHQINDSQLDYADETALLAASPAASLYGRIGLAASEDSYWLWTSSGWVQMGGGGASAPLDLTIEDAGTTTVVAPLAVGHNSTGTPAAGFGVGVDFQLESTTTVDTFAAAIEAEWVDATHATRVSQLALYFGHHDGTAGVWEGAVLRPPDANASYVDGNQRGEGSVDLQLDRNLATEIASGPYSTLIGGFRNTCSGEYGAGVFAGGNNDVQSGAYGSVILGGQNNTISGYYGAILAGKRATITSDYTYAIGHATWGQGQGQHRVTLHAISRATHVDTTWYTITSSLGGTLAVPTDSYWQFEVWVTGFAQGGASKFSYYVRGAVENDGGSMTVTIGPDGYKIIEEDDAAYDMQVTFSGTDLIAEIRRDGGADIGLARWSAMFRTLEVTYPA